MKDWPALALLIALLGAALAPLALHSGDLLYPRSGQATDLTITHWPAVAFNTRSLSRDGQIPLWRTTIAGGGPWMANPQSWLLYPPAWLFFVLPIPVGFNVLLLAHAVLAAAATYLFGRQIGLRPPGAALAGLAFTLAPWLSAQLAAGHVNIAFALAWLPVALLGAHRARTSGSAAGALLAGAAWSAALVNHLQIAAFIALLTAAWFLAAAPLATIRAGWKRHLFLLLLMPALALLLGAALLVPLAEALPYLNRGTLTVEEAGVFSLPWDHLITAVVPTYGGEPEQAIYLGVPVAFLAALGPAFKRDRATWFFLGAGTFAALFALGLNGPIFPVVVRVIPGLAWLRVPPRAWGIVACCAAVLAGKGLDSLTCGPLTHAVRRRLRIAGAGLVTAGLSLAGGLALMFRPVPPAVWALGLLCVLTAGAIWLCSWPAIPAPVVGSGFLVLAALDLGLAHDWWTEMRSPAAAFRWGEETASLLAGRDGPFRVYSPSYSLPQHTAVQHGLSLADGVDPFQLAHYARFLSLAGGCPPAGYSVTLPPRLGDASARPDADRLGLLNVRFVASSFPIDCPGLVLDTRSGDGTYVYFNARALPRAFVVSRYHAEADGGLSLDRPVDATAAQILAYTPNRIVVAADLAVPSLLVLSEVCYPGWQARVNGRQEPILCVEGVVRGVELGPGAHTVEFRYRPWTVTAGLAVSGLATAVLLAGAGAYACRRWRRQ